MGQCSWGWAPGWRRPIGDGHRPVTIRHVVWCGVGCGAPTDRGALPVRRPLAGSGAGVSPGYGRRVGPMWAGASSGPRPGLPPRRRGCGGRAANRRLARSRIRRAVERGDSTGHDDCAVLLVEFGRRAFEFLKCSASCCSIGADGLTQCVCYKLVGQQKQFV
jgi:hypothetical protein